MKKKEQVEPLRGHRGSQYSKKDQDRKLLGSPNAHHQLRASNYLIKKNDRLLQSTVTTRRKSSNQVSLQDGEFEESSEPRTGDRTDALNGTAIKHEGIKNDISQFQIKVTRIQNDVDAQSYDFENKIKPISQLSCYKDIPVDRWLCEKTDPEKAYLNRKTQERRYLNETNQKFLKTKNPCAQKESTSH